MKESDHNVSLLTLLKQSSENGLTYYCVYHFRLQSKPPTYLSTNRLSE